MKKGAATGGRGYRRQRRRRRRAAVTVIALAAIALVIVFALQPMDSASDGPFAAASPEASAHTAARDPEASSIGRTAEPDPTGGGEAIGESFIDILSKISSEARSEAAAAIGAARLMAIPTSALTDAGSYGGDMGGEDPDAFGSYGDPLDGEPSPTIIEEAGFDGEEQDGGEPSGARSITIRCVGDFVIHEEVFKSAYMKGDKAYDFTEMLEDIAPSLKKATLTVANVDGVMQGDAKHKYSGYPVFNTPPELIESLLGSGVGMITLANNHALDFYFDGLKATMGNCDRYGIDHIGGARSRAERDAPAIRELDGIKVGFLNYTESLNGKEKYAEKSATAYGVIRLDQAHIKKDIANLRSNGAEAVIVFVHWGTQYSATPDSNQKRYARIMAEAGADAIIGAHPHVVQPAVWISAPEGGTAGGRCLCAYSLGNFLAGSRTEDRDTGVIFEFTIERAADGRCAVRDPKFIPTVTARSGKPGRYSYRIVNAAEIARSGAPKGMSASMRRKVERANDRIKGRMEAVAELVYE